ncbi:transposase, partial [candidate division WOR-3 bacterium]|nr:transposase [candidate division WOR-3 bacterium]
MTKQDVRIKIVEKLLVDRSSPVHTNIINWRNNINSKEKSISAYKERKKNRLKGYDYSKSGRYFVTICAGINGQIFGHVGTGLDLSTKTVKLNKSGKTLEEHIKYLERQYTYFKVMKYIIMPDHVHMIIKMDENHNGKTLTISSIIAAYKTKTSRDIHNIGMKKFQWKRSFYDEIIRNQKMYNEIVKYIDNNPNKWKISMDKVIGGQV